MAKDPAFLFYPGDWLGGTTTFSRSQKGAYIDLLMCQFNQGRLSLDDIKDVLGSDFDSMWERKLKSKFKVDEKGFFFNERLDLEQQKRKNFTESRRKNKSHMTNHMENESVNENKSEKEIIIEVVNRRSPEFVLAWNTWLEYRKEIKKPYKSDKSILGALKELDEYKDEIAIKMIQQSINKSWQGIFPLNQTYNDNNKNRPVNPAKGGFGNL